MGTGSQPSSGFTGKACLRDRVKSDSTGHLVFSSELCVCPQVPATTHLHVYHTCIHQNHTHAHMHMHVHAHTGTCSYAYSLLMALEGSLEF